MKNDKIKKSTMLATAIAGLMLSTTSVNAGGDNHCVIKYYDEALKKDVNAIKERAGDCANPKAGHSCAGQNEAHEDGAWFFMASEQCKKVQEAVNKGDLSGLPEEIKATLADKLVLPDNIMKTLGKVDMMDNEKEVKSK